MILTFKPTNPTIRSVYLTAVDSSTFHRTGHTLVLANGPGHSFAPGVGRRMSCATRNNTSLLIPEHVFGWSDPSSRDLNATSSPLSVQM